MGIIDVIEDREIIEKVVCFIFYLRVNIEEEFQYIEKDKMVVEIMVLNWVKKEN